MNKLTLTTPTQSVVAVLAGAAIMFGALEVYDSLAQFPPAVPWTLPAMLGLLGLSGLIYGLRIPRRLEEHKLGSQEAFVALVAGKAMVITGAALAGCYAVYVMRYSGGWAAQTPFARIVSGSVTLLAALLVAGAGSLIEHNLVIKDPPDTETGHGEGAAT